jgi:DNA-binding transcriptional LysR family regulator
MDRLGNIEAFVEAAELASFTRAARRLRLSPSALSRRISQLEGEMGVQLFHRTTRAVGLSDEGRAFFERARSALRDLKEAQDATAGRRRRPVGLLRVEAPSILGRCIVVPALQRLVSLHPDVQVELTLRDYPSDLASESIDVAIRLGALQDSALVARRLGSTRMRVCGSPSYLRRKGRPRTVRELLKHARLGFALQGRVMPWRLLEAGAVRELPPSSHIVVDDSDALIDLAVGGAGLAWLCDFMIARPGGPTELVEVLGESACEENPIHALSLPSRHPLPKVRAFVELVSAELAKRAAP